MPASSSYRPFRRLAFGVATLAAIAASARADPIISEFMASNVMTVADVDGDYSSWIEIYNPDSSAVNLNGWYLADKTNNLTKWKIPAVTLPPKGYLLVFMSDKNYTDPTKELHTNFNLSTSDTFIALVKPDGVTIASQFANFPPQFDDISYGVTQPTDGSPARTGYLRVPSPKASNPDVIFLPETVLFSTPPGLFTKSFTLSLSGPSAGEIIRYVVAPPSSSGASIAEPTATSPVYTGPITINSSVIVRAEVFSADNKSRGLPATAQFVQLAANAAYFSTTLPVLVLDEHGLGPLAKDSIYHPAWLYVFSPTSNGPTALTGAPSLVTPTGMSVHGNFSSNFPKSSYDLALVDTLGYNNKQPLVGLDNDRQWDLYGPWLTDRSYIRNAYVYALSNSIGRWAPRTRFVETFVNEDNDGLSYADYHGIGVVIDRLKISSNRINITAIENTDVTLPAVTGGYIFKIDPTPDSTHYNFITDHNIPSQNPAQGGTGFIVESPDAGSLKPAQRTYVRGYIQTMENSLFNSRSSAYTKRDYLNYIDVASWVDHHLMEVFTGNVDALYHSDYFYKDQNGMLVSGPLWDFDGSMGDGDPRCADPKTWDTTGGRDLWNYDWWGQLTHDPEFMQAWIDRWQALRRNQFTTANLIGVADGLAAQIPADAAARDAARWPDNASQYPGGFLGEVAHLKDWITTRATWIDQQFVAPPTVATNGSNTTFTAPAGAQLAYTLDGSDPRGLGGTLPSNTTLTSSPLTVASSANVHVRSYNASQINAFPGSPWSSVVAGPNATAVLPRSRLINLSVLTNLAVGDNFTMGYVVGGSGTGGAKPVLVRAAGPSLTQFAVANPHNDPQLALFSGSTPLTQNDDWDGGSTLNNAFAQVGAFPFTSKNSKDAAVFLTSVPVGNNSAVVSGVDTASGTVLSELYDATASTSFTPATPRLINVSVLKNVAGGLTVGFVVGPPGSPAKNVLVRAVGPTLGAPPFNVPGVVAHPQLTLFGPSGQIATNNKWGGSAALAAAFTSVGAFGLPANSLDAALVATLAPGNYTAQAQSSDSSSGLVLVEVYELP